MVVIEAVARLLPGVLGNPASVETESFGTARLEGPQYTRPAVFRGLEVPAVLRSGNHAEIARWRAEQAMEWTRRRRPDLLAGRREEAVMNILDTIERESHAQGPAALPLGRHGARARAGEGRRQGAHPGVRGRRDPPPPRRELGDLHRAQDLLRRRRRAHLPGASRPRSRRSRSRAAATCAARASTTCATSAARRRGCAPSCATSRRCSCPRRARPAPPPRPSPPSAR